VLVRRHGVAAGGGDAYLATGAEAFDRALGGGLPRAALAEIQGAETRDAGASTGFALALVSLLLPKDEAPVLWTGTLDAFREAGLPYAPGLRSLYGIEPARLFVAPAPKLADALWIAEEAARMGGFSAVLVEVRGNPARFDLTASRRLNHRAREAGRPVLLLRQSGLPEPTAAPVRLLVSPAPAGPRRTFGGPLSGSIGPPCFRVAVSKSPSAPAAQFMLEWNVHERAFQERGAENPVAVAPLSRDGAHFAAKTGTGLAFRYRAEPAARPQPPGKQCAPHRSLG
jgi:protein ImuA